MGRKLRFVPHLVEMIVSGKKFTTWRINNERDISVNEVITFCDKDGTPFAEARVLWLKTTTFASLTPEDWEGHEWFDNREEMYKLYSEVYGIEVTPATVLEIIRFKVSRV